MTKTVQHKTGVITLDGDIYHYVISEGAEMTLEDAKELIEIGTRLTKGLKVGALVDARANYTDTNEAREYFARETARDQFVAVAMVVNTLAVRLIGHHYINSNKPNTPTRLFDDMDEAKKWLKEMLGK